MQRRWIFVGLALLCVAQVWGKPAEKDADSADEYPDDAGSEIEDYEDDDSQGSSTASVPVELLTKSQTFEVVPGSNVYLPCQLKNAEKIVVTWLKGKEQLFVDDVPFTQNTRMTRLANNTLLIKNVVREDSSDEYMCQALQVGETKVVEHKLIVRDDIQQDSVRVLPREFVQLNQGESVDLGCEASPELNPKSITWSREGHRLKNTRKSPNGIYIEIRNATRHVAGDYQCVVDTGAQNPIVKHLKLRVMHLPEIEYDKVKVDERVHQLSHYYTGLNVETNITCVVHAHPPVTKLTWFKDGHKIKTDKRISKSDSQKSHHVLTIRNTTKADLGTYFCRASNALGDTSGPEITVLDTPNQPVFIFGRGVGDAIELRWRVISYEPIVESKLLYRKEGAEEWVESDDVKVISNIGKEYIVEGRIRGIAAGMYEAKLKSRNGDENMTDDKQWGPFSELKKFDGEYANADDPESVRGSAIKPAISLMTLLLIISPFAYSYL